MLQLVVKWLVWTHWGYARQSEHYHIWAYTQLGYCPFCWCSEELYCSSLAITHPRIGILKLYVPGLRHNVESLVSCQIDRLTVPHAVRCDFVMQPRKILWMQTWLQFESVLNVCRALLTWLINFLLMPPIVRCGFVMQPQKMFCMQTTFVWISCKCLLVSKHSMPHLCMEDHEQL
jgi:hypothetical protein